MTCKTCSATECSVCGASLASRSVSFEIGKNAFCSLACIQTQFPNEVTATVVLRKQIMVLSEAEALH